MHFTSVDDQTRENNLKLKPGIFWLCLRKTWGVCVCVCVCVCVMKLERATFKGTGSVVLYCLSSRFSLCPTLCHPMDCSPPASSVHEILQARILEWAAMLIT